MSKFAVDTSPAAEPSPEVTFLRGLADLLETNEKNMVRHAEPGLLLERLIGCVCDDRDTTIRSLLENGFHSGDAEQTCADLGLLDGA